VGSRLKGRTRRKDRPASWRIYKLVVYAILAIGTIILLWYLYLWHAEQ
jgi:hypothetical protein